MKLFSPILQTSRMRMRCPESEDAATVASLSNDKRLAEAVAAMPALRLLGQARSWNSDDSGLANCFLMERLSDLQVVGAISLKTDDDGISASTSFWVGPRFWGQGCASEAVGELLRHAFQDLGLKLIRGQFARDNAAACRVMDRAGMGLDRIEKSVFSGGRITDVVHCCISASQWRTLRRPAIR